MSKLGYGPESLSVGVIAVCRIITRTPTSVSCTLNPLKLPIRRVMAAKAGMNVGAVDIMGLGAAGLDGYISAKMMSECNCKRCR